MMAQTIEQHAVNRQVKGSDTGSKDTNKGDIHTKHETGDITDQKRHRRHRPNFTASVAVQPATTEDIIGWTPAPALYRGD